MTHEQFMTELNEHNQRLAEMQMRWAIEDEIRRRELWGEE